MRRDLIDLLWRGHPAAPQRRSARSPHPCRDGSRRRPGDHPGRLRGPRRRHDPALGDSLGISTMSVYSHVNSRDDLLVLMAEPSPHACPARGSAGRAGGPASAESPTNLALLRAHPWLLEVKDDRRVRPGHHRQVRPRAARPRRNAPDDVTRDAALTFVLDFIRAAARGLAPIHAARCPRRSGSRGRAPHEIRRRRLSTRATGRARRRRGDERPLQPRPAWEFGMPRVSTAWPAPSGTRTRSSPGPAEVETRTRPKSRARPRSWPRSTAQP